MNSIDQVGNRRIEDLVKPFIHDTRKHGYENAMKLLERQYGNTFKLLARYRNEIKQMTKIKPGDAAAFRRLFNFLVGYTRRDLHDSIEGTRVSTKQNQEESNKRTWIVQFD